MSPGDRWEIVRQAYPPRWRTECGMCSGDADPRVPRGEGAAWGVFHRGALLKDRFCSVSCGRDAAEDAEASYQQRQIVNAIVEG